MAILKLIGAENALDLYRVLAAIHTDVGEMTSQEWQRGLDPGSPDDVGSEAPGRQISRALATFLPLLRCGRFPKTAVPSHVFDLTIVDVTPTRSFAPTSRPGR